MNSAGRLDEAELRKFIGQRYPGVVAAVGLVTGSQPAAEDAVQEALVRAWERSERGEVIDHLAAWVTTVALNLARSGVRRRIAEQKARLRLGPAPSTAPADVDGVAVRQALLALPTRQREVTVLRYYAGLDVAAIAAALEISEGTVKTCLHRARQALLAEFEPPGQDVITAEELSPEHA